MVSNVKTNRLITKSSLFLALVQHDQIKKEILRQNAVSLLIDGYEHLNHHSKRLLLESLGSITFDREAARILRHNTRFLHSIEDIQTSKDDGIHKAAEKIIWNLTKGTIHRIALRMSSFVCFF